MADDIAESEDAGKQTAAYRSARCNFGIVLRGRRIDADDLVGLEVSADIGAAQNNHIAADEDGRDEQGIGRGGRLDAFAQQLPEILVPRE